MRLSTVHIVVFDGLSDWEIGYVSAHLRNGDHQREPGRWQVRTVGLSAQPITTMGGLRVVPDLGLDQLDPADSALLVLPGGRLWESGGGNAFVDAARGFLAAGVPVAAVCGATFALAAAGLLDERPHTSNDPGYLAMSGYAGAAHYAAAPAVIDGDLITASGVAPVHFARAIFERLGVYEPGVLASWTKLYADRDPAGFYELMSA
ncbi:MAG TPA: DJ-1/PfpI family protein [Pseudonocardia sp.]|nr:DJ-1/PfpI family protein [Pseudonocardia sp.]